MDLEGLITYLYPHLDLEVLWIWPQMPAACMGLMGLLL